MGLALRLPSPHSEAKSGADCVAARRPTEATAIDIEPLLHSDLLSDGLVDCRIRCRVHLGERFPRTSISCMLICRRPACHIRVHFGHGGKTREAGFVVYAGKGSRKGSILGASRSEVTAVARPY